MEDPEAYLRTMAAPLAWAQKGSAFPVVRFSLEAVVNAFVIIGLLPAARAEEILVAQQPVVEAAGFRLGLDIGELGVSPGARGFQEARAAGSRPRILLAIAAGPVQCRLRGHDLVITSVTLIPEGISVRYHGAARESDRLGARAFGQEIAEDITELSITDDAGGTYLVPPGNVHSTMSGGRSGSGGTLWIPQGEFLAAPGEAGSRGDRSAVRWLEFAATSGQPVRVEIPSPAAVPTGTAEPPWPTPAESYLAELAPVTEWSIGSAKTAPVDLDAPEIVADVAEALLAVGALPPSSALLSAAPDREHSEWQTGVMHKWASRVRDRAIRPGRASVAGLAARLPLEQATAVIQNITAYEDMVSVQLYGHPWVFDESWPMITPCFRVTAVDDTGLEHEGMHDSTSVSPTYDGSGSFWFWPPVPPQAKQLRVTVSTLWEAAWALIGIPGR